MADKNKCKLKIIERQVGIWVIGETGWHPLNRKVGLRRHEIWQSKKDYHGQTK